MTFSDSRIVDFINANFIPVWESVSPVRTVTFELGEGRKVKGTISGEIALSFCTLQGEVFDILPALQSQAATLAAMKEALAFYQKNSASPLDLDGEAVQAYHRKRMKGIAGEHFDAALVESPLPERLKKTESGAKLRDQRIGEAIDQATQDLRIMITSKTIEMPVFSTRQSDSTDLGDLRDSQDYGTAISHTPFIVVEPGGRDYYRWEVARRFLHAGAWTEAQPIIDLGDENPSAAPSLRPRTPVGWQTELFVHILGQPLDRGQDVSYHSDSLEAIRIIQE